MISVGWLTDPTEASLRSALAIGAPELAGLPLRINPRPASSNPLWWSSSAVVDGSFVVKFAWSELRADQDRSKSVRRWCDWVDDVLLGGSAASPEVFVHGDLHGHNQVWDRARCSLAAVVDFEESGVCDAHFDLRYLPGNARSLDVLRASMNAYEQISGRRLGIERVMAWHVLTVLGDALWRTEAKVALPGGGSAATYVDDLADRLDALGLG